MCEMNEKPSHFMMVCLVLSRQTCVPRVTRVRSRPLTICPAIKNKGGWCVKFPKD